MESVPFRVRLFSDMPRYRIHRMKDAPRENFRWAAHTSGRAVVKPRDFEDNEDVESANPYAAWKMLFSEGRPLRPGDILETVRADDSIEATPTDLYIAKYIGFESAEWFVPESRSASAGEAFSPEISMQSGEHAAP